MREQRKQRQRSSFLRFLCFLLLISGRIARRWWLRATASCRPPRQPHSGLSGGARKTQHEGTEETETTEFVSPFPLFSPVNFRSDRPPLVAPSHGIVPSSKATAFRAE